MHAEEIERAGAKLGVERHGDRPSRAVLVAGVRVAAQARVAAELEVTVEVVFVAVAEEPVEDEATETDGRSRDAELGEHVGVVAALEFVLDAVLSDTTHETVAERQRHRSPRDDAEQI